VVELRIALDMGKVVFVLIGAMKQKLETFSLTVV
jgi:hypothetical protein